MPVRTTVSRRRPPAAARRPGFLLGVAAAGAVLVAVLNGAEPAAQAETEPVSVAEQLGMTARSVPADATPDLQPLEQLAASRNTREAEEVAAQQVQAAADQGELDRQRADADARAAAEVQAAADAAPMAEEQQAAVAAATPAATVPAVAAAVARITNSTGKVRPQTQAAADQVVSHVPGAAGITLGGTRASATDPNGHPSGLALDYMVGSDAELGDAIAQYTIDHWTSLGVEYVIWQQRMLSSPTGSWKPMEDRGSPTENHMDHVHVNYLG
jgi:hypothetical protein